MTTGTPSLGLRSPIVERKKSEYLISPSDSFKNSKTCKKVKYVQFFLELTAK